MKVNLALEKRVYVNNHTPIIEQVYTVAEIQRILRISRAMSYELVNSGAFPIIRIGKSIRIPVNAFQEWLVSNAAIPS